MPEELIIDSNDLASPEIKESVAQDRSLEDMARASRSIIRTPLLRSPYFYYTFAGLVGSVLAWSAVYLLLLPLPLDLPPQLERALSYICSAGLIGMTMGMSHGLIYRNLRTAVHCGAVGLLVAALPAFFMGGIGELFATLVVDLPNYLLQRGKWTTDRGIFLFLIMASDGFTWALIGLPMLMGTGIALRSKPLLYSAAASGMLGGFIGGAARAPILRFLPELIGGSEVIAGLIWFSLIGILVGLLYAMMEHGVREAWFILAKGPLRGKRFVFFKTPISVGSSSRCDLYLAGDAAIAPVHANLSQEGIFWLLRDEGAPNGTFVNGHRIQQCLLNHNDVVTMGETVLKFKLNKRTG